MIVSISDFVPLVTWLPAARTRRRRSRGVDQQHAVPLTLRGKLDRTAAYWPMYSHNGRTFWHSWVTMLAPPPSPGAQRGHWHPQANTLHMSTAQQRRQRESASSHLLTVSKCFFLANGQLWRCQFKLCPIPPAHERHSRCP